MGAHIFFTSDCTKHFGSLTRGTGGPVPKIRISLKGGGCAGIQYKFSFEQQKEPGDIVLEAGGVVVLVDSISYYYLKGSVLDFRLSSHNSSFVIYNPNATTSCSCGASFSVTPNECLENQ